MLSAYWVETGFVVAVLILITTFLLPLFSSDLRQNSTVLYVYWFLILIHHLMAITNAYFFRTPGADMDANGFHWWGIELATSTEWSFNLGAMFYEHLLGAVYRWFGPSHLLGEQLSILIFAFSCIVFLKIIHQLGLVRYRASSLFIFGALPTMVFVGSVTLRESYQIFFFMLTVYFGVKMLIKSGINANLIALILFSLVLGIFHHGLLIYAAFLILVFFIWTLRPTTCFENVKKTRLITWLVIPLLLEVLIILSQMDIIGSAALNRIVNSGWLEAVAEFREGLIRVPGRTTYGNFFDISSPVMVAYSSLKLYVYYLFAPFPWQFQNMMDVYAGMESTLRLILIVFMVKQWRNTYGPQRRLFGLMVFLYFSMTFLWAMGTTNYGTALRHNMLSWWILAITGVPLAMVKLNRLMVLVIK